MANNDFVVSQNFIAVLITELNMNKLVLVIIFVGTWFYNIRLAAVSVRISEIKCADYAEIAENTSITHLNHFAVEYWDGNPKTAKLYTVGTLISDKFILSAYSLVNHFSRIRAYDMYDGVYMEIDEINIVRKSIVNDTVNSFGLILLPLRYPLELNSFYRPACLTTWPLFESAWAKLMLRNKQTADWDINSIEIMDSSACGMASPIWNNTPKTFCGKATRQYAHYASLVGSPVHHERKVFTKFRNYYVFGLILNHTQTQDWNTHFAATVYDHLDWIEQTVWGDQEICGTSDLASQPTPNDQNANVGDFPWNSAIFEKIEQEQTYICAGTILTSTAVLTAAICVADTKTTAKPPHSFFIGVGQTSLKESKRDSEYRGVAEIILHPNSRYDLVESDIALLKLKSPIIFSASIKPICLPSTHTSKFYDGTGYLSGGWQSNGDQLQKGSPSILNETECHKMNYISMARYLNDNFCILLNQDCIGEIGGGLVFKVRYQWYILGVMSGTSFSINNGMSWANCAPLNLFANVTDYYDWIRGKL